MCLLFEDKLVLLICTLFLSQYLWSIYDVYHRSGISDAEMKRKGAEAFQPHGLHCSERRVPLLKKQRQRVVIFALQIIQIGWWVTRETG